LIKLNNKLVSELFPWRRKLQNKAMDYNFQDGRGARFQHLEEHVGRSKYQEFKQYPEPRMDGFHCPEPRMEGFHRYHSGIGAGHQRGDFLPRRFLFQEDLPGGVRYQEDWNAGRSKYRDDRNVGGFRHQDDRNAARFRYQENRDIEAPLLYNQEPRHGGSRFGNVQQRRDFFPKRQFHTDNNGGGWQQSFHSQRSYPAEVNNRFHSHKDVHEDFNE
jgi:hypothetical protein